MSNARRWPFVLLPVLGTLLFLLHLWTGSVTLSPTAVWKALIGEAEQAGHGLIVRSIRLPQAMTALVAGGGLAACGLLMQTLFRNPLAGPSVLGISSGASLGVAFMLLMQPLLNWLPLAPDAKLVLASLAGALGVLTVILLADRRIGDGITLLIIGLMVGYLCSALISVMQATSPANALKGYVLWGMGSFAGVSVERLPWLVVPGVLGIGAALLLVKPLNALLLGEDQAATMGVQVARTRRIIMWTTGLLAGTITAFCGPIAFLGLATPHVARGLLRSSDHRLLMPATILCGAVLALLCDLVARLPGSEASIPLNAVTSLLGAPVVAWVLLSGKRWARAA
ncbi:MAG: iron ABC transporter permease [Flavobacteriales bacterium]|nr:iron ABC transporter permease [Flavobacteriales bacterium]